ncbi:hypothetical protein [Serratia bockelmannii]|uniref:hypothetical protein n=1 Tax=Serratia bockelmannii TaxID=2703793 RepID=UPI003FA6BB66
MDKLSELKASAFSLKNMSDRKAKGLRTSTLQINAAAAKMRGMLTADAVLALLAELEAKDKRIAELEVVKADASQVFKEIGNELGCNPDNESIMMAIDNLKEDNTALRDQRAGLAREANRLETHNARLREWNAGLAQESCELQAKLATPVRLTDERTLWAGEDDYDTGHVKGWNANRIEQSALLKKQGFTVEGDE